MYATIFHPDQSHGGDLTIGQVTFTFNDGEAFTPHLSAGMAKYLRQRGFRIDRSPRAAVEAETHLLKGHELDAALDGYGLPKAGTAAAKRHRLAAHRADLASRDGGAPLVTPPAGE